MRDASEETVLAACALRFDGYAYEAAVAREPGLGDTGEGLSLLIAPVVATLALHANANDNMAAFFGLQRYLSKWGGETLTEESPEFVAYRFLFLDLYRRDVPEPLRREDECARWDLAFARGRENYAAAVRRAIHGTR